MKFIEAVRHPCDDWVNYYTLYTVGKCFRLTFDEIVNYASSARFNAPRFYSCGAYFAANLSTLSKNVCCRSTATFIYKYTKT